jgi:four helix bundle protein
MSVALPRTMTPPRPLTDRTFQYACQIVFFFRALNRIQGFPYHLSRQVLRSGTSIGANLEEGKAAQSRRDLRAKSTIALKEARETKYWLRLIRATELAPTKLIDPMLDEADQLVAILTVSVRRLKEEENEPTPE